MGSAPVTSICINPRGAVLRILQQTGGISESQLLRLLARYDAHMYIWRCLHTLCGCNFISKFLGGLLNEKYRTELCRFSGAKIYPGKGIRFIRSDSQVFLFSNSKCKRYFHNRLKPSKLTWTAMYRKQHKKDAAQEAVKKRRRTTKKPYSRSIVGATLEVIQKRRTEKPEVRDAAREAALREIKERIKKTKDEKKAKKAEVTAKTQKSQGKGIGEVSGTHPPASSRLCFQGTKRRRTEKRGLGQQDYTRRVISSPYTCNAKDPFTTNVFGGPTAAGEEPLPYISIDREISDSRVCSARRVATAAAARHGAVLWILQQTTDISESQLLQPFHPFLARYDAHMFLLTELCRFSGAKRYPGKGIRFIHSDSQVFLFSNSKCKRYFHNRLKPSMLTWTAMYRKQHKKDAAQEAVKKRRRATKKPYSRSIVGATLEVIQKRRTEKPEVRDAAREAALHEIKERIKKTKDEKKAKKAEVITKTQKSQGKGNAKGAAPKGPKLGGGGGKR
ncbi:hypothetical protein TEA_020382 [Camellia sinensis var. sinensis]|uniref:TRASH domain-containing protein n=1 Tax=Camellia sinensis var. sinensis TaxID=542762 RepID=A0A4S4DQW5_CAMSN|nr:hypothetical protein TEA_020382 [Camellia sinensis var. sinensis]